jgi:hypothetical protein
MDSQEAVNFYVANTKNLYDSKAEAAQKRIAGSFQKAMEDHPRRSETQKRKTQHFVYVVWQKV